MLPERTSDFLRTTVESCLKEIMKTMAGQFISHNTENDQYYLDLQKTIDHDAKIQDKADTLSDSQLDQYYFDALTRVLECTDQPTLRHGLPDLGARDRVAGAQDHTPRIPLLRRTQ